MPSNLLTSLFPPTGRAEDAIPTTLAARSLIVVAIPMFQFPIAPSVDVVEYRAAAPDDVHHFAGIAGAIAYIVVEYGHVCKCDGSFGFFRRETQPNEICGE